MKFSVLERPFRAKHLTGCLWDHYPVLAPYMVLRIISILVIIPFPVLAQRIVDESIPASDMAGVWFYTGISVLLLGLHALSMKVGVDRLASNVQLMLRSMRARVFTKLQFMHFAFLDRVQSGRLLSKYAFDTNNIETTVIQLITGIIPELLRSILLIGALAFINPWLLVFVAVSLPVFTVIRWLFFRKVDRANRLTRLAREKMTGHASEFISALKLVRGFGQESQVGASMDAVSDEYGDSRVHQMLVNQTLGYVVFTITTGITLLATAGAAWLVIDDKMTVGALMAMIGALPVILNPVNMLTQFSLQFFLGRESYFSIKELVDSGYVEKWRGSHRFDNLKGDIEFDQVSFRYSEEAPVVIKDLNLTIPAGAHVAFVGPSGSGKTTIVNLLLGFYAPVKGEIRIDGVPQSALAMRAFRQNCAIVMQDSLLLSGTIADNIRFGNPQASDSEVREVAREANALDFIEELPDGFQARVGERGVSLSGGQRQRIAIARALLRDPRVLILDEATSALDYESERLIQEALNRLVKGRTTITIAHRLSTIRQAQQIYVLSKGSIIEHGTWDELARIDGGAFRELLSAQT